jgi:LacI family transcriptional regulator, galactose operon repressor
LRALAGSPVRSRIPVHQAGSYRAGRQLLSAESGSSAIFASSDLLAVGLLRAAHEAELSVPQDLAAISFDGTQQAEYRLTLAPVTRTSQE